MRKREAIVYIFAHIDDSELLNLKNDPDVTLYDYYQNVHNLSDSKMSNINWGKVNYRNIFDIKMMDDNCQRTKTSIPWNNQHTMIAGKITGWSSTFTYLCAEKSNGYWISVEKVSENEFVDKFSNKFQRAEVKYRLTLTLADKSCKREIRVTCYNDIAKSMYTNIYYLLDNLKKNILCLIIFFFKVFKNKKT